jgi:hypothetical protein
MVAIFVLKDFHDCWSNPPIERKFRSLAGRLKFSKKSILITAPVAKIPAKLKDEAVIVEFPLPSAPDSEAVLHKS